MSPSYGDLLGSADDFRTRAKEGNLSAVEEDVLVISSALLTGSNMEKEALGEAGTISAAYDAFFRFLDAYNELVLETNRYRIQRQEQAGRSAPDAKGGD